MERLTDLTAILLFSFLGLNLLKFFEDTVQITFRGLILLLLGVILISNKKIVSMLLKMFSRMPFITKYGNETGQILKTIQILLKPKNFIISVLLGGGYWFFSSIILVFILKGFMSPLPIAIVLFVFPFSTLIGFISAIPRGIGTMEGSVLMILISQNISNSIAAITVILLRLFTLWIPSIVGIYALLNINKKIHLNNK